jgi:ATP-binding cassette subfamily B protein
MFKTIKFALKLFIKTHPVFFFFIIMLGIPHSLLHSVSTLVFSQRLFDSVGDFIINGGSLRKVYLTIIAAGSVFIIRQIIEGVFNFLEVGVLFQKPQLKMMKMLHETMARIDPVYFEYTKLYDSIEKADSGASSILRMGDYIIILFAIYVPYFIFMSFYLHNLQPYLLWIIALAFVPTLLSQLVKTGITVKFEDKAAPIRRESDYYGRTITDKNYYKETRKHGAYQFFLIRLLDSIKRLGKAEWGRSRQINLIELGMNIILNPELILGLVMVKLRLQATAY